jgi:flagellar basal-body rod modification protein FlgD
MTNTISTATPYTPNSNPSTTAPQSSGLASDFNTFLKMLTAQARYQDPLEPIDASDYGSQLAQFSMVEQQVKTNDALAAMFGQMSSANMASLASWVGMEARAITPAYFDGSPITISPNPASVSDRVDLVVLDESGNEVQRSNIAISASPFEWAGVDENGEPFTDGTYSFTIESFREDKLILSEPAEVYERVTEAQVKNGQVLLILKGGQAVLSTSVTGLREATPNTGE